MELIDGFVMFSLIVVFVLVAMAVQGGMRRRNGKGTKVCRRCGTRVPAFARFCRQCGEAV